MALGFGTSVNLDTFVRPNLDLVFLVDVSGSMSGEPLAWSQDAMLAAVEHLGPADRAGLVVYGSSAQVVERSRPMGEDNKANLRAAIRRLTSNGSTDMESGMQVAYKQIDLDAELSHRLMIFSDAQPNTGVTEESSFVALVRAMAAQDVGLTFIGVSPHVGSGRVVCRRIRLPGDPGGLRHAG